MALSEDVNEKEDEPVLHVLVIGFHHKRGCQVEYAFPPLIPDGDSYSNELPAQWKHLPSLALPDGSHNFDSDTAYFHLPDLENPRKTVYGISCYRQIHGAQVLNKTEETQRGIQKSVCALSRLPLYGHIQVKMSLITEAYFAEGDFTRLDLIHQTYENLNACLSNNMLSTQQLYVGLSARSFMMKFQQRALLLFKLMLLEKRVLFFKSPVEELSGMLLTLLSLHPGMLERGLDTSACIVPLDTPPCVSPDRSYVEEAFEDRPTSAASIHSTGLRSKLTEVFHHQMANSKSSQALAENEPEETIFETPNSATVASVSNEELGLPLKVFVGGNLCHPYLSLSYLDSLMQPSITGYIIGATNVLFKQKKGVADVIVDLEKDRIEVPDLDLQKALKFSTEDLRFVSNIVRHVTSSPTSSSSDHLKQPDGEKKHEIFSDGVSWEGGDEWCRSQFRFYLLCLLRTSILVKTDLDFSNLAVNHFNASFVHMWMQTRNYKDWFANKGASTLLTELLSPGHPCSGGLYASDLKLHLSNSIGNSESGKRVSQAVVSTSKALAGGLSTAKGALSSFISSFRQPPGPSTASTPFPVGGNPNKSEDEAAVEEQPDTKQDAFAEAQDI